MAALFSASCLSVALLVDSFGGAFCERCARLFLFLLAIGFATANGALGDFVPRCVLRPNDTLARALGLASLPVLGPNPVDALRDAVV